MKHARIIAAAIAGASCAGYLSLVRPKVLNWGATRHEIGRSLPGDEVVPRASLQTTRAITIDAPPSAIWPWIAQMGPRPRAGVYTYDWIERLLGIDIENSDRILPQFQHMDVGEFFALNHKGNGLRVIEVQDEHWLVLRWEPAGSTWSFVLYPGPDGTTRLVSRNRLPGSGVAFWLSMVIAMELGSLVMERKMLLGIKQRAERTVAQEAARRAATLTGPQL